MFANDMNNKLFLSISESKLFNISLLSNPLEHCAPNQFP